MSICHTIARLLNVTIRLLIFGAFAKLRKSINSYVVFVSLSLSVCLCLSVLPHETIVQYSLLHTYAIWYSLLLLDTNL